MKDDEKDQVMVNEKDEPLPCLRIGWDADKQGVQMLFKNAEFKSWDFIIACLEMAVSHAKHNQAVARAQAMQMQAREQVRNQAIAQQLKLGKM